MAMSTTKSVALHLSDRPHLLPSPLPSHVWFYLFLAPRKHQPDIFFLPSFFLTLFSIHSRLTDGGAYHNAGTYRSTGRCSNISTIGHLDRHGRPNSCCKLSHSAKAKVHAVLFPLFMSRAVAIKKNLSTEKLYNSFFRSFHLPFVTTSCSRLDSSCTRLPERRGPAQAAISCAVYVLSFLPFSLVFIFFYTSFVTQPHSLFLYSCLILHRLYVCGHCTH